MDKTPKAGNAPRKIVITPDQIAKLGLTGKLQSVIASQLKKNKTTPSVKPVGRRSSVKTSTPRKTANKITIDDIRIDSITNAINENPCGLNLTGDETETAKRQRLKHDETASILLQLNPANQNPAEKRLPESRTELTASKNDKSSCTSTSDVEDRTGVLLTERMKLKLSQLVGSSRDREESDEVHSHTNSEISPNEEVDVEKPRNADALNESKRNRASSMELNDGKNESDSRVLYKCKESETIESVCAESTKSLRDGNSTLDKEIDKTLSASDDNTPVNEIDATINVKADTSVDKKVAENVQANTSIDKVADTVESNKIIVKVAENVESDPSVDKVAENVESNTSINKVAENVESNTSVDKVADTANDEQDNVENRDDNMITSAKEQIDEKTDESNEKSTESSSREVSNKTSIEESDGEVSDGNIDNEQDFPHDNNDQEFSHADSDDDIEDIEKIRSFLKEHDPKSKHQVAPSNNQTEAVDDSKIDFVEGTSEQKMEVEGPLNAESPVASTEKKTQVLEVMPDVNPPAKTEQAAVEPPRESPIVTTSCGSSQEPTALGRRKRITRPKIQRKQPENATKNTSSNPPKTNENPNDNKACPDKTQEVVQNDLPEKGEKVLQDNLLEKGEKVQNDLLKKIEKVVQNDLLKKSEKVVQNDLLEKGETLVQNDLLEKGEKDVENNLLEESEKVVENNLLEKGEIDGSNGTEEDNCGGIEEEEKQIVKDRKGDVKSAESSLDNNSTARKTSDNAKDLIDVTIVHNNAVEQGLVANTAEVDPHDVKEAIIQGNIGEDEDVALKQKSALNQSNAESEEEISVQAKTNEASSNDSPNPKEVNSLQVKTNEPDKKEAASIDSPNPEEVNSLQVKPNESVQHRQTSKQSGKVKESNSPNPTASSESERDDLHEERLEILDSVVEKAGTLKDDQNETLKIAKTSKPDSLQTSKKFDDPNCTVKELKAVNIQAETLESSNSTRKNALEMPQTEASSSEETSKVSTPKIAQTESSGSSSTVKNVKVSNVEIAQNESAENAESTGKNAQVSNAEIAQNESSENAESTGKNAQVSKAEITQNESSENADSTGKFAKVSKPEIEQAAGKSTANKMLQTKLQFHKAKLDVVVPPVEDVVVTPKRRGRPKRTTETTPVVETSPTLGKRKRASINYAAMNEGLKPSASPTDGVIAKRKGRSRNSEETKKNITGAMDRFIKGGNLLMAKRTNKNAPEDGSSLTEQTRGEEAQEPASSNNAKETPGDNDENVNNSTCNTKQEPNESKVDTLTADVRSLVKKERGEDVERPRNSHSTRTGDESVETEEVEVVTPKRRGRKKNVADAGPNERLGESTVETPAGDSLVLTRSRRGRSSLNQPSVSEIFTPVTRKRTRKEVKCEDENAEPTQTTNSSAQPKRGGRKRKIAEDEDEQPANDKKERVNDDEEEGGEVGRKKKTDVRVGVENENETTTEKMNRILMTVLYEEIAEFKAKREQADTVKDKDVPKDSVKCALCRCVVKKTAWPSHKQKEHNNLSWIVGEPELDLKNVYFVLSMLTKLYVKKKPLQCHRCPESIKSVYGFLSHILHCGRDREQLESYKIQCPHCDSRLWPYSLSEHITRKHKYPEQKKEKAAEDDENAGETTTGGSRKRAAAKKATALIQSVSNELFDNEKTNSKRVYKLKKIKIDDGDYEKHTNKTGEAFVCNINSCNHESKTPEEAQDHFKLCKVHLENNYCCKSCESIFKTKKEFYCHYANKHKDTGEGSDYEKEASDSESDDGSEGVDENAEEENEQRSKPKKAATNNKSENVRPLQLKFIHEAFYIDGLSFYLSHWCYKYHLEFCEKNYDKPISLFSNMEGKWTLLDASIIRNYLPKLKLSMLINHEVHAHGNYNRECKSPDFKKYRLFESKFINGHNMIYCGGPISTMSWSPSSYTAEDAAQILAIAVFPDPQKPYSVASTYRDKVLIQFWNYGVLKNAEQITEAPKLEFCLAHDNGPIWNMEWCPSGCRSEEQLGLVAVSGSDSIVYGYRVPQLGRLGEGVVFEARPVFKLVSSRSTDLHISGVSYYATSISWSKASGHKHICVGYSSGLISVFDLSNTSEILYEVIKGVGVFYPYTSFHGHNTTVTGVALFHMHGGNRWLASSSLDRTVKFWNLEELNGPISLKNKCQVREMVWLSNWISTVDAADDWTNPLLQTTSATQLREISAQHITTLMYACSSVNTISASDWSNTLVQGSLMGEAIGCIMKHMLPFSMEIPVKRYFLSNTRLTTVTGEKVNDCKDMGRLYDYKTSADDSKLAFIDYDLKCYKNVMKNTEQYTNCRAAFEPGKLHMYPIQSITCVRTNPNHYSYLYTAVGYQTGFVRLLHSKFLS